MRSPPSSDSGTITDGGVVENADAGHGEAFDSGAIIGDADHEATPGDGKGWRCTSGPINSCGGQVSVDCVQDVDDGGLDLGLYGGSCDQVCPRYGKCCCAKVCNPQKINEHEYGFTCTSYGTCC
jgi:hypothetical protein